MATRGNSNDPPSNNGGSRLRVSFQPGDRPVSAGFEQQQRPMSFGPGENAVQSLQNNRQFREAQAGFEDQIQALESDKVSLMKRLNMVLSELESATHEKAAIGLRVADQERQSEELKRKLEEAASLKQAVNRNLQDELRYERELNEKLREELSRYEQEKEQVMGRLKDSEGLTQEIQRETAAIKQSLQKKSEELKRLEREHETNIDRLRELTSQLENLRGQEMHGKGEKRRLEEELSELTREKENLLRRMNDLTTRYDEYVASMDRERADILRANRQHVKLLTAKLFLQTFDSMLRLRRKDGLQAMQSCSQQLRKVETLVARFVRVLQEHHTESQRRFLRLWYRNAMDFQHHHYKKVNLIEYNVAKKRKLRHYFGWRTCYLKRRQHEESKLHSVAVMSKIVRRKQNLALRNKLCRWRDFVELRQYQSQALLAVITRHARRDERTAFVLWLALVKSEQMSKRYENMSTLVTELSFKQRVFLALKQACLESRTERTTEKFIQWKAKCQANREKQNYQRKKLMVERLQGVRTERLIKQVFDAIRYCNVLEKYEATRDRLGQEIPIREELEQTRDALLKQNKLQDKYHALRKCCIRHADAKYRAIMVWKENIDYLKRTMNRLKIRLIELHRRNLSVAFGKWREGSDRRHMVELLGISEGLQNQNQDLKNELGRCYAQQNLLDDCKKEQQLFKAARLRNLINRNYERRYLKEWARQAYFTGCLETGLMKATKTLNRRRMKNTLEKYKMKIAELKREEYVEGKASWFVMIRSKKLKQTVLDAWQEDVNRFKQARTFLLRSIKGVDRLISNEAFTKWKLDYYSGRRDVFHRDIAELQRRQKGHEDHIAQLNKQIQVNHSTEHHLNSKLHTQSQKILANFVSRFIHSSLARGFYTWLDELKEFNTRRRFLKSTLTYWIKQNEGRAFRIWAEFTLRDKEQEIARELGAKEAERKELQRMKDEQEIAQTKEVEQLQNELQHSLLVKQQLQVNYEKALETHISRTNNNVYVNKRRNIFCTWREYVKKEKNAVNIIGAIARQQLKMEIFSRIRLVARERFLEANAERIINKFFVMVKNNVLTRLFSKWRVRTFTDTVREMKQLQEHLQLTKVKHAKEAEVMEAHKQAKAFKILRTRKQREVANAWIEQAKRQHEIKVKSQICEENLRYLQIKWATQKWQARVQLTQKLRVKNQQAISKFIKKTLTNCYKQWHLRVQIEKTLLKKAFKFGRRMSALALADGFSQILHFSKSFKERDRERKIHGMQSSFKIIQRLLKKRMSESFLSLRLRAHKKNFKQEHFTRMLKHVLQSRMRHFFGKWRHNSDRIRLAETVNTEGDVVLERNETRRNVKALKDFLCSQGYSQDEIQGYLTEKSEQQKSKMHRAIVGLFFRNSDFEIIPKALNQWKRWVEQRRLVKQWANYCVNAMNHPLHWAFRKWKLSEEDARQKLKHVLKKDLIKKIIDDELAIGSAQHRLDRMDETIENLGIQRDSLLQHYIAGQRLALALGRNNHQRTMFRAFIRWKRETRDYEQHLLLQQLERTNLMIQDLMAHVNRLDGIHSGLVQENEELRQAALDGIEIAKAVQDLTREREQLSQDLQERASTIKRLIEDNNTLAFRLNVAQKEAEQLKQLNREALQSANTAGSMNGPRTTENINPNYGSGNQSQQPERDRYY